MAVPYIFSAGWTVDHILLSAASVSDPVDDVLFLKKIVTEICMEKSFY